MTGNLYHFTCDHGRAGIGNLGELRSAADQSKKAAQIAASDPAMRDLLSWVWLTDLETPMRDALGLTQHLSKCDRTAHRYQVIDRRAAQPIRWIEARRYFNPAVRDELESSPGAMPAHWFIAQSGVQVVYHPLVVGSALRKVEQ